MDANLPVEYLPGERLRLEAYRALASATTDDAVDAVRAELVDRFGPIPAPVENLLAVARFKVMCRAYGVTEVSLQGSPVRFTPLELPESAQLRLSVCTTARSTSKRWRPCRCRDRRVSSSRTGPSPSPRSAARRCETSHC